MKILKLLLNIFKLFGFISYTPVDRTDKSDELPLLIWKFIHLLFASALLVSVLHMKDIIFDHSSPISGLTDMFQFVMPSIAHHAIILESFWNYKSQRIIWSYPRKLAGHLSKLGVNAQPGMQDALWGFFVEIIFLQGICLASELWIIYGISIGHGNNGWLYHWFFKLMPFSMGRMSLLFHALFVTLNDAFMKAILRETHHLGTMSKRKERRVDDALMTNKLLILKDAYEDLALMNRLINDTFTISHTLNFFSLFITIAACFFWICSAVIRGTNHPLETTLCPVSAMIVITYITSTCQSSLKNIVMLPHELHRIEITKERCMLRSVVQGFALQIEHQPIRHCAGSLFELNSKLLKEMFAMICTFTIIFVQFMPQK